MLSHPLARPERHSAFDIAIICALSLEAEAMIALFDDLWELKEQYEKADGDINCYTLGRVGSHHVVLVHMPHMGKVSAATVAANLQRTFPSVRVALLVGICGGVPFIKDEQQELILGDIVIATQVIQSDFGRLYPHGYVRKSLPRDNLGRPNLEISAFLSSLQTQEARGALGNEIQDNLRTIQKKLGGHEYPGASKDQLFAQTYRHKHQDPQECPVCARCVKSDDPPCEHALKLSCEELGCDIRQLVLRNRIDKAIRTGSDPSYQPAIHFGDIASGDQVIKSASERDQIAKQEGTIAFEMEGTGFWETIPTIIVKGVCDYADSHKDKRWQHYAASTAAACAKGIIKRWKPTAKPAGKVEPPPLTQVFSGTFTAGRAIFNGGSYTGNIIL